MIELAIFLSFIVGAGLGLVVLSVIVAVRDMDRLPPRGLR